MIKESIQNNLYLFKSRVHHLKHPNLDYETDLIKPYQMKNFDCFN